MSDHIKATIDDLQDKIAGMEKKVAKTKQLVNLLAEQADLPPIYPDNEIDGSAQQASKVFVARPDEFVGIPLNTSVKNFLMRRKAANEHGGPATAEEIYDGLTRGGYRFAGNRDEGLNGLKISLGKSSHTFTKLPHGAYALLDWYPGLKRPKPPKRPAVVTASTGSATADEPTLDTDEPTPDDDEPTPIEDDEDDEKDVG